MTWKEKKLGPLFTDSLAPFPKREIGHFKGPKSIMPMLKCDHTCSAHQGFDVIEEVGLLDLLCITILYRENLVCCHLFIIL